MRLVFPRDVRNDPDADMRRAHLIHSLVSSAVVVTVWLVTRSGFAGALCGILYWTALSVYIRVRMRRNLRRARASIMQMAADSNLTLKHWKLASDGKTPVECDLLEWARWLEQEPEARQIALDRVAGCIVSTVFVGIDLNPLACLRGYHQPTLWETAVISEATEDTTVGKVPKSTKIERYTSYEDALAGHRAHVERIKERSARA